jgi:acylphosphatase
MPEPLFKEHRFTISITVSGKVQGVYYRQSTKEKAIALGITGSVKNLKDGSVYIIATGTKEQLDGLVAWCRQGPSKAKVADVITMDIAFRQFDEFSILRF